MTAPARKCVTSFIDKRTGASMILNETERARIRHSTLNDELTQERVKMRSVTGASKAEWAALARDTAGTGDDEGIIALFGLVASKLAHERESTAWKIERSRIERDKSREAPRVATTPQQRRAMELAEGGELSKAAKCLLEQKVALGSEYMSVLAALHPEPTLPQVFVPQGTPLIDIDPKKLQKIVENGCSMRAPGPTGWTEELLRDAIRGSSHFASTFARIIKRIINNEVGEHVRDLLTNCRLVAIGKPDGGVRPLAIGEVFLKIAGQWLLNVNRDDVMMRLEPLQQGMAQRGAEKIVHEVRQHAEENPQHAIYTIDAKNAFNSAHRHAIANEVRDIDWLRSIFSLVYGRSSWLFFFDSAHGETLAIKSEEGTRQGDSLAGLLFCLALQPLLQRVQERFPRVRIWAYMDDVTLAGPPAEAAQAFRMMKAEMRSIGLVVNESKTYVHIPSPAVVAQDAEYWATMCGIKPSVRGTRVLGAWIGDDESTRDFLVKELQKYERFFEQLSSAALPGHAAFHILSACGGPRWNYISRTHRPEAAEEATARFDMRMLETFATICSLDVETLCADPARYMMLALPVAQGGLGLSLYTLSSADNYAASFDPTSDSQRVRAELRATANAASIDETSGDWKQHREACARPNAKKWLYLRGRSEMKTEEFAECIKLRLQYVEPHLQQKTGAFCTCGAKMMTMNDYILHCLGCAKRDGFNVGSRHDHVNEKLAETLKGTNVSCRREPTFNEATVRTINLQRTAWNNDPANARKRKLKMLGYSDRPDHEWCIGAERIMTDTTILSTTCATHRRNPTIAMSNKAAEKIEHYADVAELEYATFAPLVMEAMGGCTKTTLDFITRLVRAKTGYNEYDMQELIPQTLGKVAQWVQIGNARIRMAAVRAATLER